MSYLVMEGQDDPYSKGATVFDSGKIIRLGFMRKVYGILSVQLIMTVAWACLFMFEPVARTWIVTHSYMMWIALIAGLLLLIGLFFVREKHPYNMFLLMTWTATQGVMIGTICGIYACSPDFDSAGNFIGCQADKAGQLAIAQAFGITMGIFIVLTIFTLQSKIDFSFLGAFLSVALMILLFWGLLIWIFGAGWSFYYLYSLFGAIVFCLYILYDTYLLAKRLSPDEYILAAINLYLDIINLFLFILALLGGGRRN